MVTSIGPGALAGAGRLVGRRAPTAWGCGICWATRRPKTKAPTCSRSRREEQSLFLKLYSTMGQAYSLHTPWALPTALRRGLNTVDHPHRGGPFFLLMPMNVQPIALQQFNLDELPTGAPPPLGAAADDRRLRSARPTPSAQPNGSSSGSAAARPGPGLRLLELLDLVDGVAVVARSRSAPCRISIRAT